MWLPGTGFIRTGLITLGNRGWVEMEDPASGLARRSKQKSAEDAGAMAEDLSKSGSGSGENFANDL
ncbi:MAG: hypothetical protein ACI9NQ_000213 [Paracoccaceae bacterium]